MIKFIFLIFFSSLGFAQSYIQSNSLIETPNVINTSGGTSTLTLTSQTVQNLTGTNTQVVVLPDATTLKTGKRFDILNDSTGIITVRYNDGTTALTVPGLSRGSLRLISTGSSNGTWSILGLASINGIGGAVSTVSSSGTTTLTVNSTRVQILTGSQTQTYQLPDVTTISPGFQYIFNNNSSGILTINKSDATLFKTVPSGGISSAICTSATASVRDWDFHSMLPSTMVASSASFTVSGSINSSGQLTNSVSTGTAPFVVSSTTRVANLNVATAGTADTVTTNANLTGDVTSVGNATTLTNAPVIAKVLTGYVSSSGTISATDSILQAIQKLNGNDATNANLTGPITSSGNATSIASQTGTGTKFVVDTSPALITPNLGTPTAATLTSAVGLPISTGVSGLGTGIATWLATPSSANLLSSLTTSTGSGVAVFGTSPTFTTGITNPQESGGSGASSTLILQSTTTAGTADAIIFKTGSQTERARITSAGNVGIGVTPVTGFQVKSGSNIDLGITTGAINSTFIGLNAINDTNSANIGMELRASQFAFTGPSSSIIISTAGGITFGGLSTVTPGTNGAACFSSTQVLGANSANCIVSLLEYKTNITKMNSKESLDTVSKLADAAIYYNYTDKYLGDSIKEKHARDQMSGFGAEWVEKIDPRYVLYDRNGKLSGVRYEQLAATEASAINELKNQNDLLKSELCKKDKSYKFCVGL